MVDGLIAGTRSDDANLRWAAVDALGSIRDPGAIGPVMKCVLRDPDVHVRWRAIWAMTRFDERPVIRRLLTGLSSTNPQTALNAAVALSVLGRQEALERLLEGLRSSDAFRRWEVVNALGAMRDPRAVKALAATLRNGDADLRREAALSLGRTGSPRARDALRAASREDPDPEVKWRADLSLQRIGAT